MKAVVLSVLFWTTLSLLWCYSPDALAQVMQSNNFQIQSDSVNVGGGNATSSNYRLESTVGEVATGDSDSSSFSLRAGYQQMQEVYLSLSNVGDLTLTPTIPGVTGGSASGTVSVVVTTDSLAGYQLSIAADNDPAMQSDLDSIADYVPIGAVPDFTFNYAASDALFGYSPEGGDITVRYRDNGADTCGIDTTDTSSRCWDGLSTTSATIARGAGSNHPDGATTTVRFQVSIGGAVAQTVGTYVATTTITALPL